MYSLPELLFALKGILKLVKGLLQLGLNLVQVVHLVFRGLLERYKLRKLFWFARSNKKVSSLSIKKMIIFIAQIFLAIFKTHQGLIFNFLRQ